MLLSFLAVVAIGILRLRNLFAVVMLSGIYSLLSAGLFVALDAVDVAFTEAAVGGGIATLLMLGTLALARALLGPTIYDRVLAVNSFGTKIVLLISVFGFLTGRPDFLDISLIYALINFIGTIAVLKFLKYGDLGTPGSDEEPAE